MIGTLAFAAAAAFALTAEDQAWMMKVDYRRIKEATDRCKTVRRSCLAFGEEPIPASDWSWILAGLGPEERELMRRRYSIPSSGMTAANAAAVRASRPRGDDYRDAVGSTPAGFRERAGARVAALAGAAAPAAVPAQAPPARRAPPERPAPATARTKPRAEPPPPGRGPIPAGRLARLAAPFARAAESGRFDARSLGDAMAWAKKNPPLNEEERALRERAKSLGRLLGERLSPADADSVRALAKDAGLKLSSGQEENLVRAVEAGLSWGEKFRLWRAQ